jgi:hypothetical protein
MEKLQRSWLRRVKIAAVLLVIVGGAGIGLAAAASIFMQPVPSPRIESPARPVLPARIYIPDPPEDAVPVPHD